MKAFPMRTGPGRIPSLLLRLSLCVSCLAVAGRASAQGLPPVPFPPENPPTEAKRVLGKILFWEEQLSSDDSIACGTCHVPGSGGADPRPAVHPGSDGVRGTADDVHGSFGVARCDADGVAVNDPTFGFGPQVTGRLAPSFFADLHAPEQFWDGRAASSFADPLEPSAVLIPVGGALESQSVGPILNSVEMACEGRAWSDVTAKLARVRPLRLADDVPADAASAIAAAGSYGALFANAFGSADITPARIAFAIATYERTLVPDQTPWDRFVGGNAAAMTAAQVQGWNVFRSAGALCNRCHVPPFFTNHDFLNVGLRPAAEDEGRLAVSGDDEDFGDMKVPGLRNVGLRDRLMHNGAITGVPDAIDFYLQARGHQFFLANIDGVPPNDVPLTQIRIAPGDRATLIDFLSNALTDPRVANESFPFDRPLLASETGATARCSDAPRSGCATSLAPERSRLTLADDGVETEIAWKLTAVEATTAAEFGDPAGDGALVFCLYDGDAASLVFEGRMPADGACEDGSCWRAIGRESAGKGWRLKSASGEPDGARRASLRAGADGAAKVALSFRGDLAATPVGSPALPLALPLVAQLQSETGGCWEATYSSAAANGPAAFATR